MEVIAFINQKGGVGKTTTTIHMGSYLAKKGYKILMIDSDPQIDLSKDCGYFENQKGIKEWLLEGELNNIEIHKNLDLLPGYRQLELIKMDRSLFNKRLKGLEKKYDYVLYDCQPKLIIEGLVTINEAILCSSDYMVIPMDADIKAISGANEFLNSVKRIKEKYNNKLTILGMLFNIVTVQEKIFKEYYKAMRDSNENLVFKSYIRKDTKIKQAASMGKTIFEYDPKSRAAIDFKNLGKEILNKITGENE